VVSSSQLRDSNAARLTRSLADTGTADLKDIAKKQAILISLRAEVHGSTALTLRCLSRSGVRALGAA